MAERCDDCARGQAQLRRGGGDRREQYERARPRRLWVLVPGQRVVAWVRWQPLGVGARPQHHVLAHHDGVEARPLRLDGHAHERAQVARQRERPVLGEDEHELRSGRGVSPRQHVVCYTNADRPGSGPVGRAKSRDDPALDPRREAAGAQDRHAARHRGVGSRGRARSRRVADSSLLGRPGDRPALFRALPGSSAASAPSTKSCSSSTRVPPSTSSFATRPSDSRRTRRSRLRSCAPRRLRRCGSSRGEATLTMPRRKPRSGASSRLRSRSSRRGRSSTRPTGSRSGLGWARTYDAEYVALAARNRCALLTTDARLARRARGDRRHRPARVDLSHVRSP